MCRHPLDIRFGLIEMPPTKWPFKLQAKLPAVQLRVGFILSPRPNVSVPVSRKELAVCGAIQQLRQYLKNAGRRRDRCARDLRQSLSPPTLLFRILPPNLRVHFVWTRNSCLHGGACTWAHTPHGFCSIGF